MFVHSRRSRFTLTFHNSFFRVVLFFGQRRCANWLSSLKNCLSALNTVRPRRLQHDTSHFFHFYKRNKCSFSLTYVIKTELERGTSTLFFFNQIINLFGQGVYSLNTHVDCFNWIGQGCALVFAFFLRKKHTYSLLV